MYSILRWWLLVAYLAELTYSLSTGPWPAAQQNRNVANREPFQNSRPRKPPVLMITAGPTGAGKSTLNREAASYFGMSEHTFVAMIDDMVTDHQFYKKGVLKFMYADNVDLTEKIIKAANEKSYFPEIGTEQTKALDDLYFKTRSETDINPKHPGKSLNSILNDQIAYHLRRGSDVLLETTGTTSFGWIVEMTKGRDDIVYVLLNAPLDDLKKRNVKGAAGAYAKFTNKFMAILKERGYTGDVDFTSTSMAAAYKYFDGLKGTKPDVQDAIVEALPDAPRLPNLGGLENNFNAVNKCAKDLSTANFCKEITQSSTRLCGSHPMEAVLFYYNDKEMTLLADTRTMLASQYHYLKYSPVKDLFLYFQGLHSIKGTKQATS